MTEFHVTIKSRLDVKALGIDERDSDSDILERLQENPAEALDGAEWSLERREPLLSQVTELKALVGRCHTMLAGLQFADVDSFGASRCPGCLGKRIFPGNGADAAIDHAPDCALAALISETKPYMKGDV